MTTARLISKRPLVRFDDEGRRVLQEELIVDLGQRVKDLITWDVAHWSKESGQVKRRVTTSRQETTVVTVPAGLVYDGASLPSGVLVRLLIGPKERYEVAAVLHDALYQWGAPRGASDRAFWIVSRSGERRVNRARGWLAWAGLRVGGWRAWRGHRRRREAPL